MFEKALPCCGQFLCRNTTWILLAIIKKILHNSEIVQTKMAIDLLFYGNPILHEKNMPKYFLQQFSTHIQSTSYYYIKSFSSNIILFNLLSLSYSPYIVHFQKWLLNEKCTFHFLFKFKPDENEILTRNKEILIRYNEKIFSL